MVVEERLDDVDSFKRRHAMNLSLGGMFLRTPSPHALGSTVYLRIRTKSGVLLEGSARVVHVQPSPHPLPGMGIEFVQLDERSRALLWQIVCERSWELEGSTGEGDQSAG